MINYTDLLQRLRDLAYDNEARLTGTPMIPLHENTIISAIDAIERLEADNAALLSLVRIADEVRKQCRICPATVSYDFERARIAAMREGKK